MPLLFVDRDLPLDVSTPVPNRPILGGVVHDTETADSVLPRRAGSWHWLIGRDGTLYRDVSEEHCAHHVARADEWRPSWIVASPVGVSDVNYCTIGIELVSHQNYRDAGEPYTEPQYAALRELVVDIESRRGQLWWVGHGQLQLDRTDPVMFDWRRASFSDPGLDGRRRLGVHPGHPAPPDDLGQLRRALDDANAIKAELEAWIRAREGRRVRVPVGLAEYLIARARGQG